MQHYVLAVDGGNTKTVALVASLDGMILGSGRSGCGDIYAARSDGMTTEEAALFNVEQAVKQALQMASLATNDLLVGAFGMAGADWPEDYQLLQARLCALGLGRRIIVQNDAMAVLHAGSSHNVGVSVTCGTGATTGARGPDGRQWYTSFWQWGVEGSQQLGAKALIAVARAEIGVEPPTSLRARLLELFRLENVEEVLHKITARASRGLPLPSHTDMTPVLFEEAERGDLLARRILQEHGRELGKYAHAAAQRVGIAGTAFPLVLAGGVLRHPFPILADAIIEEVRLNSPAIQPTRSRFEPVVGVLLTALEAAGSEIDEALLTTLTATLPDAALFETRSTHL